MYIVTRRNILVLIKAIVTLGVITFLVGNSDVSQLVDLIDDIDYGYVALAVVVLLLQIVISAVRWKFVLESCVISISHLDVLRYLAIGLFFNQIFPSSMGGDVLRGYYLYKAGSNLKMSLFGVLTDRVLGILSLVFMAFITIFVVEDLFLDLASYRNPILYIVVLSMAAILLGYYYRAYIVKLRVIRILVELLVLIWSVVKESPRNIVVIFLSFFIHFLSIAAVMILVISLQLDISWLAVSVVIPLGLLVMAVPVSIGGWGMREGVLVLGLGYYGVPQEQALLLSILFGVLTFLVALPGGIVWLTKGADAKMVIDEIHGHQGRLNQ